MTEPWRVCMPVHLMCYVVALRLSSPVPHLLSRLPVPLRCLASYIWRPVLLKRAALPQRDMLRFDLRDMMLLMCCSGLVKGVAPMALAEFRH